MFPRYSICVPGSQNNISHFSLSFTTHSREPRPSAGVLCHFRVREFTKRSRSGHDFAMFFRYPKCVPRRQNNISHFSLSFTTHTQQRAPAKCRGFLYQLFWKFTKSSRSGHDSAMFLGYHNIVPRKQKRYLPFLPLLYNTHKRRAPAVSRGPSLFYPLRPTAPLSRSRRFIFRLRAAE